MVTISTGKTLITSGLEMLGFKRLKGLAKDGSEVFRRVSSGNGVTKEFVRVKNNSVSDPINWCISGQKGEYGYSKISDVTFPNRAYRMETFKAKGGQADTFITRTAQKDTLGRDIIKEIEFDANGSIINTSKATNLGGYTGWEVIENNPLRRGAYSMKISTHNPLGSHGLLKEDGFAKREMDSTFVNLKDTEQKGWFEFLG